MPYSDHAFIYTVAYAIFISILRLLSPINQRIAFGPPRDVDLNEEVIVITGGASGLGRCVAEIYALKSASVVVLDIKDVQHADIVEGVDYYFCDVGDKDSVKKTWAKIELEVCLQSTELAELRIFAVLRGGIFFTDRHSNYPDQ